MKKVLLSVLFFVFSFFSLTFASEDKFVLLTEQNPPFNFMSKNEVNGITINVLKEMFKRAKLPFSKKEIKFGTWSEVFKEAMVTTNALLFSTSRIKEREYIFQWIGPIANVNLILVAKKNNKINIDNVKNLKKYKITTVKDTSSERAFINSGGDLNKVTRVSTFAQAYKMLDLDRADGIIVTDIPFNHYLVHNGKSPDDYEVILKLAKSKYYIVANKQVPKKIVQRLQKELDNIKTIKKGEKFSKYQQILNTCLKGKYLKVK